MIYGEGFNIIHMPKTGGTWLRRVCERLPSSLIREIYPHHMTYSALEGEAAEKPTYVFVRNPFDWYLSLYGHKHGNVVHKRHEFCIPYDKLNLYNQHDYRRFSGSFSESMLHLAKSKSIQPAHEIHPATGWMSNVFREFTFREDGKKPIILKYEDGVRDGLRQILERHSSGVTDEVRRVLRDHQDENVSERPRNYRSEYSHSLRALVELRDSDILREYNYEF